jgi:hypothetical protein
MPGPGPGSQPPSNINGQVGAFQTIVAVAYTVTLQDRYIYSDATAGAVTVTLPPAIQTPAGFTIGVKKKDAGGNAVTVARPAAGTGSTDTIDGAANVALAAQFNSVLLVCDGVSQWCRSSNAVATGGF